MFIDICFLVYNDGVYTGRNVEYRIWSYSQKFANPLSVVLQLLL